jgi:hypothetical protein
MASFPTYVDYLWRDLAESDAPIVIRSDMDRGVAHQRRIASDVVVSVSVTVLFRTKKQEADFMNWFDKEIGSGASWFVWLHPKLNSNVNARIVAGSLGPLKPSTRTWDFSQRSMTIEYLRSVYA